MATAQFPDGSLEHIEGSSEEVAEFTKESLDKGAERVTVVQAQAGANERPTIGRIVHYVYPSRTPGGEPQCRPAIVVNVWGQGSGHAGSLQLQVFNDSNAGGQFNDLRPAVDWQTSVEQDEDEKGPGTWHWPERA